MISAIVIMKNENIKKWDMKHISDEITDSAKNIVIGSHVLICIMKENVNFHLEISETKHVVFFPSKVTDCCVLS